MVNPLPLWEIQARLLFSIVVAGKSEKFATGVIRKFLVDVLDRETPFMYIQRLRHMNLLDKTLRACKSGSYSRIGKAFRGVLLLDAARCTVEQLESVHGIGPKTARFFIMWTREGVRYAALDRHVLKWMRYLGYVVPANTPTGQRYRTIENRFLEEADKRLMTPRELDAKIWGFYSAGGKEIDMPAELWR